MRRTAPIVLVALLVAACSSSPVRDYYRANEAYTTAVQTLVELRKAGKIDDQNYRQIDPLVQTGDNLLDEWYAELKATPEGGKPNVSRAVRRAVESNINELILWGVRLTHGRK